MLPRLLCCVALVCALLATKGSAQPADCGATFRLTSATFQFVIVPGVKNCFSCALDAVVSDILWQVTLPGTLVPTNVGPTTTAGIAEQDGNYLILPTPENYVGPGFNGQRMIRCNQQLQSSLFSPVLAQPQFDDVTINEGDDLMVTCMNTNPPVVSSLTLFEPNGEVVPANLGGVFTVPSAGRNYSGTYTCLISSTINNDTVMATAEVVIQYPPEVTPLNTSSHEIALGRPLFLQCDFVGVPPPTGQWRLNSTLLADGAGDINIIGGAVGDSSVAIRVPSVGRDSGGTYTCSVNNAVGSVDSSFTVLVLVPPDPVTNLMVTNVDEREVSLSWMTGFDGNSPILRIGVDVFPPDGGQPFERRFQGDVNMGTIGDLLPFREYTFSVAAVNLVDPSERVNITASTISLRLGAPTNVTFEAGSSTNILLTWMAPMFDPDTTDAPSHYIVEFSRPDGSDSDTRNISASDPLMVNFTSLMKGTMYRARVVAFNVRMQGNFSEYIIERTDIDSPSEPLNLNVEGVAANALNVTWERPADNGGSPITDYRVIVVGTSITEMVSRDTLSLLIRRDILTENTTYTVTVSAANNEQGFGTEATAMGTTQSITEPQRIFDQPMSIESGITNSSAVVMWAVPDGNIDSYIIQYVRTLDGFGSNQVMNVTVNGTEMSVRIDNLMPETTYEFRVAVSNSRGTSEFSPLTSFTTLAPDPPIITSSSGNAIDEGTTIILNCSTKLVGVTSFIWRKDMVQFTSNGNLEVNPTYLRIRMATLDDAGAYTCAVSSSSSPSLPFELQVMPTPAPTDGGINQTVIIIVASVGGAALLIFVVVVVLAICCLCCMKSKSGKGSYAMKLKERPNVNWIETSTQFVPATGNQRTGAASSETDGLAFDYSVDLQTHSSFNTMEKQKIHSTSEPIAEPAPPSHPVGIQQSSVPGPDHEVGSPAFQFVPSEAPVGNGNDASGQPPPPSYTSTVV